MSFALLLFFWRADLVILVKTVVIVAESLELKAVPGKVGTQQIHAKWMKVFFSILLINPKVDGFLKIVV